MAEDDAEPEIEWVCEPPPPVEDVAVVPRDAQPPDC